jgi:hypothetical protein
MTGGEGEVVDGLIGTWGVDNEGEARGVLGVGMCGFGWENESYPRGALVGGGPMS